MRLRTKKIIKKPGSLLPMRKKTCRFCTDKNKVIDYKDVKQLEFFIKERGGIVSTRGSGNCAKHQRLVSEEIKKARFLALVPYVRV
jgi:small subunit ribosomal protein S18